MTRALIIMDDDEESGGVITQVQLKGGWNPNSKAHDAAQALMIHLASLAGAPAVDLSTARRSIECTHEVLGVDGLSCALCGASVEPKAEALAAAPL